MATESTDPSERPHPHNRLDNHDQRLTDLERFKERVKGGLMVISFLIGSGVVTAIAFSLIGL
jgi:hypothetical protein